MLSTKWQPFHVSLNELNTKNNMVDHVHYIIPKWIDQSSFIMYCINIVGYRAPPVMIPDSLRPFSLKFSLNWVSFGSCWRWPVSLALDFGFLICLTTQGSINSLISKGMLMFLFRCKLCILYIAFVFTMIWEQKQFKQIPFAFSEWEIICRIFGVVHLVRHVWKSPTNVLSSLHWWVCLCFFKSLAPLTHRGAALRHPRHCQHPPTSVDYPSKA